MSTHTRAFLNLMVGLARVTAGSVLGYCAGVGARHMGVLTHRRW
jgi:hypothetical protein